MTEVRRVRTALVEGPVVGLDMARLRPTTLAMAHVLNDRSTIVTEAVDGLLASSEGRLARLDGYPDIKVVLRADWQRDHVAVVSGGGSGHEPAHAGLVGEGLLTAAVCGDIFASPSADAVLAAILAVTGDAGCLLIIKNYAGDRLNFGLAAERARAAGRKVETVIVADDVAIEDAPQPRGIAGTLFVHKVAGHAAASGQPLAEVASLARRTAKAIQSLGIAVSTCTIPGQATEKRLPDGEAELGLGIHGEPGFDRIALPKAQDLAELMTTRISHPASEADRLALLVNNLGSTTALEMQLFTQAVLDTTLGRRVRLLLGPAPAMTALDMHGISISVIALDDEIEAALAADTNVPAWPRAKRIVEPDIRPLPKGLDEAPKVTASEDAVAARKIAAVCDALIGAEDKLNALDAKVGDGDCGSTFAAAAHAIRNGLDALPQADHAALCDAMSRRLSRAAGGSSGVLLSIAFAAAGAALGQGATWADAARHAVERLAFHGGAKRGDRTMLDALVPAVEALGTGGLAAAAKAAREGADATAGMRKAATGRSSYLAPTSLEGHADPGAIAVAVAFEALAQA